MMKKMIIVCITALLCSGMLSYSLYLNAQKAMPTTYTVQTQDANTALYGNMISLGYCDDMMYCLNRDTGDIYAMNITAAGQYRIFQFSIENAEGATENNNPWLPK